MEKEQEKEQRGLLYYFIEAVLSMSWFIFMIVVLFLMVK